MGYGRQTTQPVPYADGWWTQVGWAEQRERYVFPGVSEAARELLHKVTAPWVFLKVCAGPEEIRISLPERWTLQPAAFLMTLSAEMRTTPRQ